uniref:Uncharacterized protein n=1 Tax=Anguilla anguilla TaxID=7936 RepID=A0A0E9PPS4_ANGAN
MLTVLSLRLVTSNPGAVQILLLQEDGNNNSTLM